MANEAIGHIKCPWCASPRMRVSLDKNGKVGCTCSACHFQGFARGQLSDTLIRQAMTPARPAPPEPAPGQEIAVPEGPAVVAASLAPDAVRGGLPTGPGRPKAQKAAPVVAPELPAKPARKGWDLY